jgi:hypothetical protein
MKLSFVVSPIPIPVKRRNHSLSPTFSKYKEQIKEMKKEPKNTDNPMIPIASRKQIN